MTRTLTILSCALLCAGCGKLDVSQEGTWRLNDRGNGGENCLKIYSVAVDSDHQRVYVQGILTPWLAVVDTHSKEVVDYFDTGLTDYHLADLAVKSSERKLFLADQKSQTVIRIDTTNGHLSEDVLELPAEPSGLAVSGAHLLVALGARDAVYVYRTSDLVKVAEIPMYGPQAIQVANGLAHVALNRDVPLGQSGSRSGRAVIDLDSFTADVAYFGTTGAKSCAFVSAANLHVLCSKSRFWAVDASGALVKTWGSDGVEYKQVAVHDSKVLLLTRDGADSESGGPRGSLSRYDPSDWSLEHTWTLGLKASRMDVDHGAGEAWISAMGETNLYVVDLDAVSYGPATHAGVSVATTSASATPGVTVLDTELLRVAGLAPAQPPATGGTALDDGLLPTLDVALAPFPGFDDGVDAVDVGESVGAMALSPDGDRGFVAARLGGGQIEVWELATNQRVATWSAGLWPAALAVRAEQDELFVLNHFESSLSVLDSDSGDLLRSIDLGIADGRSDYLPDMDIDTRSGYVYTVHPEAGVLVQVKLSSSLVTSTAQVSAPIDEDGDDDVHEGRLQVITDGVHGYVYVLEFTQTSKILYAYEQEGLQAAGHIDLTHKDWDGAIQNQILCADGRNARLFVGRHVLRALSGGSLSSSCYLDTLRKGTRVLGVGEGYVLAVGTSGDDLVAYALSGDSYKTRASKTLTGYTYPVPNTEVDRDGLRLLVGDLPTATVEVFHLHVDR